MNESSLARHQETLNQRHAALERDIHIEESRPAPDTARIAALKVHKLHLKDVLEGNTPEHTIN